MKRLIIYTALLSFSLAILVVGGGWALAEGRLPGVVKLENARVRISEIDYVPGKPRERYVRPTDQVIIFLEDCRYQRLDSKTKEKTIIVRKSGDVIFHMKGEDAPELTNLGTNTYRTLVIGVK